MSERRVVVTGIGLVSPHGQEPQAVFARLMRGESAVEEIAIDGSKPYSNVAARVAYEPELQLPPTQRPDTLDRVTRFAMAASAAAMRDSGLVLTDESRHRAGVSFGTGMGAANALEETFRQSLLSDPDRIRPLTVLKVMNNAPAGNIAIAHGLGGPDLTYSCACSSSSVSIGEAFRQIRHGYADTMIAGGAEAPLTFTFFKAWDAMHVLAPIDKGDPSRSCKPFAQDRKGLVLGEGAAMVVLEEREAAIRRGARIYAEIRGFGSSNDFAHITKPSVAGQAKAMSLALADGGINADDIDYINAHGTATQWNDVTETGAVKSVFGARAASIPVTSTKSVHGHLLGGAGALEFVIALLAMQEQAVPPTANLDLRDPACDLDNVPNIGRRQKIRMVMSNSFAFGGTNAVLIAGQA